MARTHGRCRKGERLRMGFPHGHRKTTTLVAGLRLSGMVAPMVLDGPINGESFAAWVEQFLIPELEPGSIVVIDNLGSHKGSKVRKLLAQLAGRLTNQRYLHACVFVDHFSDLSYVHLLRTQTAEELIQAKEAFEA